MKKTCLQVSNQHPSGTTSLIGYIFCTLLSISFNALANPSVKVVDSFKLPMELGAFRSAFGYQGQADKSWVWFPELGVRALIGKSSLIDGSEGEVIEPSKDQTIIGLDFLYHHELPLMFPPSKPLLSDQTEMWKTCDEAVELLGPPKQVDVKAQQHLYQWLLEQQRLRLSIQCQNRSKDPLNQGPLLEINSIKLRLLD